jgi:hypothetical protein
VCPTPVWCAPEWCNGQFQVLQNRPSGMVVHWPRLPGCVAVRPRTGTSVERVSHETEREGCACACCCSACSRELQWLSSRALYGFVGCGCCCRLACLVACKAMKPDSFATAMLAVPQAVVVELMALGAFTTGTWQFCGPAVTSSGVRTVLRSSLRWSAAGFFGGPVLHSCC